MSDKLIFMHLPKCGGSTLKTILHRNYKEEDRFLVQKVKGAKLNLDQFIELPESQRNKLKLLEGHLRFGIHQYLPGRSEYFTMMRNPIDRLISYYYYLRRSPDHRLHKNGKFNMDMDLYDFVCSCKEKGAHNGQIHYISGIYDSEKSMLEKAIHNIEKHFSFVGIIEKYNESLVLLQDQYNWKVPYYQIKNKTLNRPSIEDIDQKTIEAIKELNNGDFVLYHKMTEVLNEKIKNCSLFNFKRYRLALYNQIYWQSIFFKTLVSKV